MNKLTQDEYDLIIRLLEKKKAGCDFVIDNWTDEEAIANAKKSLETIDPLLNKLDDLQKDIVELA